MGRLGRDESNVQKLVKAKSLLSNLYTAQCCIFNNFSMVKHRHQFWDWISISVFKVEITNWPWISPQFTSIIRKLALVFFFDGFWVFWKKIFFKFLKISILWPLTFYSDPALAYCDWNPVSELMSMLNHTEIVENAALCSSVFSTKSIELLITYRITYAKI